MQIGRADVGAIGVAEIDQHVPRPSRGRAVHVSIGFGRRPGPKASSQSVTCDSGKNQGRLKEKPPKARKFIRATGCIQLANLLTYAPIVLSWRTRNDSALDGDTRLSLAGWKSWSVKKAPSRGQEISVSGRRRLSRYRRFRRGKCLLPARFCLCAGYCDRCGPSRAGGRFPRNLQDRIRN